MNLSIWKRWHTVSYDREGGMPPPARCVIACYEPLDIRKIAFCTHRVQASVPSQSASLKTLTKGELLFTHGRLPTFLLCVALLDTALNGKAVLQAF